MKFESLNPPLLCAGFLPAIRSRLAFAILLACFFSLAAIAAPEGIYVGQFSGQSDNGGFAMFVRNGQAEVVGFNSVADEGVFIGLFEILEDGSFDEGTIYGGFFRGQITANSVTGQFESSAGTTGSFTGSKKSSTGRLQNSSGFYYGSYSGDLTGTAAAVLAADGTIFFFVVDDPEFPNYDGSGGGSGTINMSNNISLIIPPNNISVSGSLNTTNNTLSGTYNGGGVSGSFALTRQRKAFAGTPSNVRSYQVPGTHKVEVHYDLIGPDANTSSSSPISLRFFRKSLPTIIESIPSTDVEGGALGPSVQWGANRKVVWDAGAHWPESWTDFSKDRDDFSKEFIFKISSDSGSDEVSAESNLTIIDAGNPDIEELVKELDRSPNLPGLGEFENVWDTSRIRPGAVEPVDPASYYGIMLTNQERNKRGVFFSQGPTPDGGGTTYRLYFPMLERVGPLQWELADFAGDAVGRDALFMLNGGRFQPLPEGNREINRFLQGADNDWSHDFEYWGQGETLEIGLANFKAQLNDSDAPVQLFKRFEFPRQASDLDTTGEVSSDLGFAAVQQDYRHLDPNATKLVVVLHGWNPDGDEDMYARDEMAVLLSDIRKDMQSGATRGVSGWDLYAYNWAEDATTGPAVTNNPHSAGLRGSGQENGTQAAEAGYQHGLILGKLMREKCPNLEKIHIIAHSAGTWVARSLSLYLAAKEGAAIEQQVTLLDPYIPHEGFVEWVNESLFDGGEDSRLSAALVTEWHTHVDPPRMENIYSDDSAVKGTNERFWDGLDVETIDGHVLANLRVGRSLFGETGSGGIDGQSWNGHGGPMLYYAWTANPSNASNHSSNGLPHSWLLSRAETAKGPEYAEVAGWKHGLFRRDFDSVLAPQIITLVINAQIKSESWATYGTVVPPPAASFVNGLETVSAPPPPTWAQVAVHVDDEGFVWMILLPSDPGEKAVATSPVLIEPDGNFVAGGESGLDIVGQFDLGATPPTLSLTIDGSPFASGIQRVVGSSPYAGVPAVDSVPGAGLFSLVLKDGTVLAVLEGIDENGERWQGAGTGTVNGSGQVQLTGDNGFALNGQLTPGGNSLDTPIVTPPAGVVTADISPASQPVTALGETYQIQVTSNGPWAVQEELPWLSASPMNGNGNGTVTVTVTANGTGSQRQGVVMIGGQTHTVTQGGELADWQAVLPGPGIVYALAVSGPDVYVGGFFSQIGALQTGYGIAKWDGQAWSALGEGFESGDVRALAFANGILYAGGTFLKADGVTVNRIAKWDGASWQPMGTGMNNTVRAITVIGTEVYAGGDFSTAGGMSASRIAKWDGSSWSALGTGVSSGAVRALAVSGSSLYAGGVFTSVGGAAANNIARWDLATSSWSTLGGGLNNGVSALSADGGGVFAGGSFSQAGGQAANKIAFWDGSAWHALGTGVTGAGVTTLVVVEGRLYAGGIFDTVGGVTARNVGRWDGQHWHAVGSGVGSGEIHSVDALVVSGSALYAGGYFSDAGGQEASNLAHVQIEVTGLAPTPEEFVALVKPGNGPYNTHNGTRFDTAHVMSSTEAGGRHTWIGGNPQEPGDWSYTLTGPHTGTLVLLYDGYTTGQYREVFKYTFTSLTEAVVVYEEWTNNVLGFNVSNAVSFPLRPAVLGLNPPAKTMGAAADSYPVEVASIRDWTASSNASWVSVTPDSGSKNLTVTVTLQANQSEAGRTATITIGGQAHTVTQSGSSGAGAVPLYHYTFDETLAEKNSLLANAGTSGSTSFVDGPRGKALRLNDFNSHGTLPAINFAGMTATTVAGWVKEESLGDLHGTYYFFWGDEREGSKHLGFGHLEDVLGFAPVNGSVNYNAAWQNQWTHFAVVHTETTSALFVNGLKVKEVSQTGSKWKSNATGYLGGHFNSNYWDFLDRFQGAFDDLMIFDRALSGVEVAQLAGATSSPFDSFASAAGLTGDDALPLAEPHRDGVPNLLKYAFNMNAGAADRRMMTRGTGVAGLPHITAEPGPDVQRVFRFEFLRRVGGGLVYTPLMNGTLDADSWLTLTDEPEIIPIDGTWERVIYEEMLDPDDWPRCFGKVEVSMP